MKKILTLILILFVTTLSNCYYDSEEKLYPVLSTSCDLENVTFAATIKPILQASCYTCHSNSNYVNQGSGIKLENYDDVKIQASSRLMGSIKHEPGYIPMPNGGGKLPDCEINQIQKWIDNGMPNN
ncbi:MAG: hypothetical protein ACM3O8_01280 [Methylococcaceae bacterium]|nr:hypothetical protein [Prolixibacteraceae bacterium]